MPVVRIVHLTEYAYHQPVQPMQHRLMLFPRGSHDLKVQAATLDVTPEPSRIGWAHDVSGNSVCCVEWDGAPTRVLRFVVTLEVDHQPSGLALPLDPLAGTYPFSSDAAEQLDLAPFLRRVEADCEGVAAWARGFLSATGSTRTLPLLVAITRAIRDGFRYEVRDTEGVQPPGVTLRRRAGACRDLAVLMMDAVRSLGLPARFVAGYLYDDAALRAAPLHGGGATHAWCAVHLPGAGWVEFDPTNGLIAGRNLVRVCTARAPEQAVPIRGAYAGRPEDFAGLTVRVEAAVRHPAATTAA